MKRQVEKACSAFWKANILFGVVIYVMFLASAPPVQAGIVDDDPMIKITSIRSLVISSQGNQGTDAFCKEVRDALFYYTTLHTIHFVGGDIAVSCPDLYDCSRYSGFPCEKLLYTFYAACT